MSNSLFILGVLHSLEHWLESSMWKCHWHISYSQRTNMSPNINGWKIHFNSPFCCRHLSFQNCDSLWARGFPTKNTGNFWSFGKWESAATNPNESHGGRCPDGRLDWVFANGRHKLAGWRIAWIAAGERSVCLQIHRFYRSFQESQRLTTWKIHDSIQTV